MEPKASGKSGATFEMDDPLFITGCFVVIYVIWILIWMFLIKEISMSNVYYRYFTSYPVYYIRSFFQDIPGLSYPYHYIQKWCAPEPGLFGACTADFSKFTQEDNYAIAKPYNIFFLIVMVVVAVKMFLKMDKNHPSSKFSKTHDLHSFMKEQSANYEHLNLFNQVDLIDKSIGDPLYGLGFTSKQFVYHYQLLAGWEQDKNGSDWVPYVNRKKTEEIFAKQLGRPFSGWRNLTTSQKMVFSILMPMVAATQAGLSDDKFEEFTQDSENMRAAAWQQFYTGNSIIRAKEAKANLAAELDQIMVMELAEQASYKKANSGAAQSKFMTPDEFEHYKKLKDAEIDDLWLTDPDVDVALFETMIAKYAGEAEVKSVVHKFAYITTIMFEMMLQARRLGVLQPAEFRWLRFYDRPLWYVINSIGRKAPFAEAAGVFSHYTAEAIGKSSYLQPMVMPAVDALNSEIQKYKYTEQRILDVSGVSELWKVYAPEKIHRLYPELPSQSI